VVPESLTSSLTGYNSSPQQQQQLFRLGLGYFESHTPDARLRDQQQQQVHCYLLRMIQAHESQTENLEERDVIISFPKREYPFRVTYAELSGLKGAGGTKRVFRIYTQSTGNKYTGNDWAVEVAFDLQIESTNSIIAKVVACQEACCGQLAPDTIIPRLLKEISTMHMVSTSSKNVPSYNFSLTTAHFPFTNVTTNTLRLQKAKYKSSEGEWKMEIEKFLLPDRYRVPKASAKLDQKALSQKALKDLFKAMQASFPAKDGNLRTTVVETKSRFEVKYSTHKRKIQVCENTHTSISQSDTTQLAQ